MKPDRVNSVLAVVLAYLLAVFTIVCLVMWGVVLWYLFGTTAV